jgi:Flp pilus assembly pilin Flp
MKSALPIQTSVRVCAGQSAIEYLLVLALIAVVFILGEGSVLSQLTQSLDARYQRYTWALSQP